MTLKKVEPTHLKAHEIPTAITIYLTVIYERIDGTWRVSNYPIAHRTKGAAIGFYETTDNPADDVRVQLFEVEIPVKIPND